MNNWVKITPFGKQEQPQVESRRRWGRYPIGNASVTVTTDLHTFEATTVDESIGGLGLITNDTATLFPGQRVTVVYHDVEMEGLVTFVANEADGNRRVSIRWPDVFGKADRSQERPFFVVNGMTVACQVTTDEDEDPARIRLWDDTEFQVPFDKLIFRTKEARRSELQALENQAIIIATLYEIEMRVSLEVLIERILDFEFAGSVV